MSVAAMAYVWQTDLSGSQKLMLLAIADRADEKGVCYPGLSRLAAKCGIKKRAAQRLISKLEEIGEIVVQLGGGTETQSGKTNRYFMKKFRDTLGIETPEFPARGAKTYTPSRTQGVQKRTPLNDEGVQIFTPHGVQIFTPNTTEDPTDKNINYIASPGDAPERVVETKIGTLHRSGLTAAFITGMDWSQAPGQDVKPEVDDKQRNKTARGLIAVFLKSTKQVNSKAYAWWMEDAQALVDNGITPAHIAKFIDVESQREFWQDKSITWNHVRAQIITWRDNHEQQRQRSEQQRRLRKAPLGVETLDRNPYLEEAS